MAEVRVYSRGHQPGAPKAAWSTTAHVHINGVCEGRQFWCIWCHPVFNTDLLHRRMT